MSDFLRRTPEAERIISGRETPRSTFFTAPARRRGASTFGTRRPSADVGDAGSTFFTTPKMMRRRSSVVEDVVTSAVPPAPDRSFGEVVGDTTRAFGAGALGSATAVTDVFGADNAASGALRGWREDVLAGVSPGRQAELDLQARERAALGEDAGFAEVFGLQVGQTLRNPAATIAEGAGGIVPLAVGAGAAVLAGAPAAAAGAIATGLGVLSGLGATKGATYEGVLGLSDADLMEDADYSALRRAGVPEAVAKQEIAVLRQSYADNPGKIAAGGVIGGLAGRFGADKAVASLLTGRSAVREILEREARGATLRGIAGGAAREALTEGPQEGAEQLLGNLGAGSGGARIDPMSGVPESIAAASLMSLVPGGAATGVAGFKARRGLAQMDAQDAEEAGLVAERDARTPQMDPRVREIDAEGLADPATLGRISNRLADLAPTETPEAVLATEFGLSPERSKRLIETAAKIPGFGTRGPGVALPPAGPDPEAPARFDEAIARDDAAREAIRSFEIDERPTEGEYGQMFDAADAREERESVVRRLMQERLPSQRMAGEQAAAAQAEEERIAQERAAFDARRTSERFANDLQGQPAEAPKVLSEPNDVNTLPAAPIILAKTVSQDPNFPTFRETYLAAVKAGGSGLKALVDESGLRPSQAAKVEEAIAAEVAPTAAEEALRPRQAIAAAVTGTAPAPATETGPGQKSAVRAESAARFVAQRIQTLEKQIATAQKQIPKMPRGRIRQSLVDKLANHLKALDVAHQQQVAVETLHAIPREDIAWVQTIADTLRAAKVRGVRNSETNVELRSAVAENGVDPTALLAAHESVKSGRATPETVEKYVRMVHLAQAAQIQIEGRTLSKDNPTGGTVQGEASRPEARDEPAKAPQASTASRRLNALAEEVTILKRNPADLRTALSRMASADVEAIRGRFTEPRVVAAIEERLSRKDASSKQANARKQTIETITRRLVEARRKQAGLSEDADGDADAEVFGDSYREDTLELLSSLWNAALQSGATPTNERVQGLRYRGAVLLRAGRSFAKVGDNGVIDIVGPKDDLAGAGRIVSKITDGILAGRIKNAHINPMSLDSLRALANVMNRYGVTPDTLEGVDMEGAFRILVETANGARDAQSRNEGERERPEEARGEPSEGSGRGERAPREAGGGAVVEGARVDRGADRGERAPLGGDGRRSGDGSPARVDAGPVRPADAPDPADQAPGVEPPPRKAVNTETTKAGTQTLLPGASGMLDTTGKVGKLSKGQEDVSRAPLFTQDEEAEKKADAAKQTSLVAESPTNGFAAEWSFLKPHPDGLFAARDTHAEGFAKAGASRGLNEQETWDEYVAATPGEPIYRERFRALFEASKPASLVKAPALFVQIGDRRFEVKSFEDASKRWEGFRDAAFDKGAKGTALPRPVIVDQDGKQVARIAQNGRIFPPAADWRAEIGQKPLYVPGPSGATVDVAAAETEKKPSEAQIEAGNYRKGKARISGMDISIENEAGTKRRPEWPTLKSHYGYVKGTESKDGEHIDAFIKPGTPNDYSGPVFVINQTNEKGAFDEHKAMIGWPSEQAAIDAYKENYTKGWDRFSGVADFLSMDEFKTWTENADTTKPAPMSFESKKRNAGALDKTPRGSTIEEAKEPDATRTPERGQSPARDDAPDKGAADSGAGGVRSLDERGPEEGSATREGRDAAPDAAKPGGDGERISRSPERPGVQSPDGRGEAGDRRASEPALNARTDYTIQPGQDLGAGGAKAKFKANTTAIRLLQKLREEGRRATSDEQETLIRYVGWGGLKQAFNKNDSSWASEYAELKALLSPEEYAAARASVLNAHYTSVPVVEGIWRGLRRLGFKGKGRALEPASGIGHFLGLSPAGTNFTAIELDKTTGGILEQLYQKQNVIPGTGFQEVNLQPGSFDVAVGNPPFGSEPLSDRTNPDLPKGLSIHNFFFAKSVDALRPGGVLAMVVSNSFLDAQTPIAREWIAKRTKLLGAIRLPNTAFLKNAGTEVTTDIVFLQKLPKGEEGSLDWTKVGKVSDIPLASYDWTKNEGAGDLPLNSYFVKHPEMMLGEMKPEGKMYRKGTPTLAARPGVDLQTALNEALDRLPENVFEEAAPSIDTLTDVDGIVPEGLKVGSVFVTKDGKVAQRIADMEGKRRFTTEVPKNATQLDRIRSLIGVRDALRDLMRGELTNGTAKEIDTARKRLNSVYDSFVKRHGYINSQVNRSAFRDDVDLPLLESLEPGYDPGLSDTVAKKLKENPRKPSAGKADIFKKRVLFPFAPTQKAENPKDALLASLNEKGGVDMDFMAKILGKSPDEILSALGGVIFRDPTGGGFVHADEYLGGPVKAKLAAAQAAVDRGQAEFQENVDALERVIPPDIDAIDIAVRIGSPWIPGPDMAAFVAHLVGGNTNASFVPAIGRWFVKTSGADPVKNSQTWGTPRKSATDLIEDLMSNKAPVVRDNIGTSREPQYVINEAETSAAQAKADELAQAFKDWIWEDPKRRERLAREYNDKFNTEAPKKYDGSHLTLPGASPLIGLRPHQKSAIWRALQDRTILLDHVVGAGKTFAAVASVMESRRLGIARKPMIVVPNHLVRQWRDDFYRLYPNANILATTEKDFDKQNRQRLFSKIATGDWDAVIVAKDSLKKIGMPGETMDRVLREQVTDITEAIESQKIQAGADKNLTREMERIRAGLEEKMQSAKDRTGKKDQAVTFDELGVDGMIVDEAHDFKNLFFFTSMRTAGLGNPKGSGRAFDLFVKMRYLTQRYGGKALRGFATGTPVSNSLVEMYTMQRFMKYDELRDRGIHTLDGWAGAFGNIANVYEVDTSGTGYRMRSRFAQFVNMPELMGLYKSFADVVTMRDLEEQAKARGDVWPVPQIKGGKPRLLVADRSPYQASYFGEKTETGWTPGSILARIDNLKNVKDPREDNMLKITNDARKAGLDYRLVDPGAGDYAGSKINKAADEIVRIHRDWKDDRGAQLVFLDLSTPKSAKGKATAKAKELEAAEATDEVQEVSEEEAIARGDEESISMDDVLGDSSSFSVYDDLHAKLLAKGIPAREIAFIHDYDTAEKKKKLFAAVNRGDIRVLMGSTGKMGAGMNVQERLVALHHLDAPWRPSDLEQREGRIIRQGNALYKRDPRGFEIEILRYATKQTYDTRMWQLIEHKANGVEQLRRGDPGMRVVEDVGGEAANAGEMKAAASGNPLIEKEIKLRGELKRLESLEQAFKRNKFTIETQISQALRGADRARERADELTQAGKKLGPAEPFELKFGRKRFEDKAQIVTPVLEAMKSAVGRTRDAGGDPLEYRGLAIRFVEPVPGGGVLHVRIEHETFGDVTIGVYEKGEQVSPGGLITRVNNWIDGIPGRVSSLKHEAEAAVKAEAGLREEAKKTFKQAEDLARARKEHTAIVQELKASEKPATPPPAPEAKPDPKFTANPTRGAAVDLSAVKKEFPRSEVRELGLGTFEVKDGLRTIHIRVDDEGLAGTVDKGAFQAAYGRSFDPAKDAVVGAWVQVPRGGVMWLAKTADSATLRHERFHYEKGKAPGTETFPERIARAFGFGKRIALTDAERDALYRKFEPQAKADSERRNPGAWADMTREQREKVVEEYQAEAYAQWSPAGAPNALFSRILEFARRFWRAFRPSWESAFERVSRGETSEGTGGRDAGTRFAAESARIQPGDPRRDENFKKWFAGSKVVDANGKPLVVYHGTTRTVRSFVPNARPESGRYEPAVFFTDSPFGASAYAEDPVSERKNPKPNVVPVYIKMENPRTVDFEGRLDLGDDIDAEIESAREFGNDGLIIENADDGHGGHTQFVVWDPTQIKSATGNRGTFDPKNPDIRYSVAARNDSPATGGTNVDAPKPARKWDPGMGRPLRTAPMDADELTKRVIEASNGTGTPAGTPIEQLAPPDFHRNFRTVLKSGVPKEEAEAFARIYAAFDKENDVARGKLSWEQGDKEALKLLGVHTREQFMDALKRGVVFNEPGLRAATRIMHEVREEHNEAMAALNAARETGGGAIDSDEYRAVAATSANIAAWTLALRGEQAEAARAFNARKDLKAGRTDSEKLLGRMFKNIGGLTDAQAAEIVKVAELEPERLPDVIRRAMKPGFWDYVNEWRKGGLLWSPRTFLGVNPFGNALKQAITLLEIPVGAAIDKARGGPESERQVRAGELAAAMAGLADYGPDALKQLRADAWDALRGVENFDVNKSRPFEHQVGVIPGPLGKLIRTPFRFLQAADDFFKETAKAQSLYRQAFKRARNEGLTGQNATKRAEELIAIGKGSDWTDHRVAGMIDKANYMAMYETFTLPTNYENAGIFGSLASAVQQVERRGGVSGAVGLFAPFKSTPAHIAYQSFERTPFGFFLVYNRAKELDALRKSLDTAKGLQREAILKDIEAKTQELVEQMARAVIGTAVFSVAASMAALGLLTGSGPADWEERKVWMDAGNIPTGIKVGDSDWYAYDRFEPAAASIAIAANMPDILKEKTFGGQAAAFMNAMQDAWVSKTYLQGLEQFGDVITDPKRYGEKWLRDLVGSFVPAAVAQTAETVDPVVREKTGGLLDGFRARVPGLSDDLPASRTGTGEPAKRTGRLGGGSPMNPFGFIRTGSSAGDPLAKEFLDAGYTPSPHRKTLVIGVGPKGFKRRHEVDLTPAELEAFRRADARVTDRLRKLIETDRWQNMDPYVKKQTLQRFYDRASNAVREVVLPRAAARLKKQLSEAKR